MAQALAGQGVSYAAWVSEPPRGPEPLCPAPLLRRFADARAMQAAIAQGGFDAVLDASHSFDRRITHQGAAAAGALGLPCLRLERPAWTGWPAVPDAAAACARIGAGARVFSAAGWDSLRDFSGFKGDALLLRQTQRHDRPAPYPFVQLVFGDPPFSVHSETALFTQHRVDTLLCRNLGGAASAPKLEAAAALGLEVLLIDRPAVPAGLPRVERIEAALDWVAGL